MKIVVIAGFLFLFLQGNVAQNTGRFTEDEENCIKQLKLDKTDIESVIYEDINYLPENNEKFNDFLNCYWKKSGYQNPDGTINYDHLVQLIKDFPKDRFGSNSDENLGLQIATDAVDGCSNIPRGHSQGQTAAKTYNCITRHIEEYVEEDR